MEGRTGGTDVGDGVDLLPRSDAHQFLRLETRHHLGRPRPPPLALRIRRIRTNRNGAAKRPARIERRDPRQLFK